MAYDIFTPEEEEKKTNPNNFEQTIKQDEEQAIANETSRANELIADIQAGENPYTALAKNVERHKVHDPRLTKARQAMGSLYDALQIIGSATGMALNQGATPASPTLASAAAAQSNIAQRLQQAQQQADKEYDATVQGYKKLSARFESDRRNAINKVNQELNENIHNIRRFYDQQRYSYINKERDRRNKTENTILRNANEIKKANIRAYGSSKNTGWGSNNRPHIFPYNGIDYTLPRNKEKAFSADMARLIESADIDTHELTKYARATGVTLHMAILSSILNAEYGELDTEYRQMAQDILDTYFTAPAAATTNTTTQKRQTFKW